MDEHQQYMADFMTVFEALQHWAPGSEQDTLKALSAIPNPPQTILELGCGNGAATTVLAKHSTAKITALDNEQAALDRLAQRLEAEQLSSRVESVCASMTDLPFSLGSFDLIWAEGSAYIMGVNQALQQWRPLLMEGGCLMLSDLVWLTDAPSTEAQQFWSKEYPDMQGIATRMAQIQEAGYELLDSFALSRQGWQNYYQPLAQRVSELQTRMADSAALKDIAKEIAIYRQYADEFGYQMFILRKG